MDLAERLTSTVTALSRLHDRVVVGIDGPPGADKSRPGASPRRVTGTLAVRLTDALPVKTLHACVDGFNRPRAQRYQRGVQSPEGYYLDSFDYQRLRQ